MLCHVFIQTLVQIFLSPHLLYSVCSSFPPQDSLLELACQKCCLPSSLLSFISPHNVAFTVCVCVLFGAFNGAFKVSICAPNVPTTKTHSVVILVQLLKHKLLQTIKVFCV